MRTIVFLASVQCSLAFFGLEHSPSPARFPFERDSRNAFSEESATAKLRAVRGLPVAHKSVAATFGRYSEKRVAADTLGHENNVLAIARKGEMALDGCLTARHVELIRAKCGHFVEDDESMGAISCTTCAAKVQEEKIFFRPSVGSRIAAPHRCTKKDLYSICDKMMASSWLKKRHAALAMKDYVVPEFLPNVSTCVASACMLRTF